MTIPAATRRILLCATGMSPQVVTETLYALAVKPARGKAPWTPTEVHLVSTGKGAENARLKLLSDQPGWFHRICRDYSLPRIAFDASHIHELTGEMGQVLEDIRTPAENEAMANQFAQLVRTFTEADDTELHISIAGGRKTMGYYLGYALSLFGRPQDRLSHVLVSSPFEAHPEFYYPTPYEHVIHTRDPHAPQTADCRHARVDLAEIPFVRLRDGLPERLLTGVANFMETVDAANRALGSVRLDIDLGTHRVIVNGETDVDLGDRGFVLYAWLAHRALTKRPDVSLRDPRNTEWRDELLPFAKRVYGPNSADFEDLENALQDNDKLMGGVGDYLAPILTRVNKRLADTLGRPLARRCAIQSHGSRGSKRYRLPEGLDIHITG